MKVITGPDTRWSYANVWEARSINGGPPKFSVSPYPQVGHPYVIKSRRRLRPPTGGRKRRATASRTALASIKLLRDGDTERPDDPAYANAYFINANSATAPGIVDADLQPILDRSEVYSGVYGRASVTFTPLTATATGFPAASTTCRRLGRRTSGEAPLR